MLSEQLVFLWYHQPQFDWKNIKFRVINYMVQQPIMLNVHIVGR